MSTEVARIKLDKYMPDMIKLQNRKHSKELTHIKKKKKHK